MYRSKQKNDNKMPAFLQVVILCDLALLGENYSGVRFKPLKEKKR